MVLKCIDKAYDNSYFQLLLIPLFIFRNSLPLSNYLLFFYVILYFGVTSLKGWQNRNLIRSNSKKVILKLKEFLFVSLFFTLGILFSKNIDIYILKEWFCIPVLLVLSVNIIVLNEKQKEMPTENFIKFIENVLLAYLIVYLCYSVYNYITDLNNTVIYNLPEFVASSMAGVAIDKDNNFFALNMIFGILLLYKKIYYREINIYFSTILSIAFISTILFSTSRRAIIIVLFGLMIYGIIIILRLLRKNKNTKILFKIGNIYVLSIVFWVTTFVLPLFYLSPAFKEVLILKSGVNSEALKTKIGITFHKYAQSINQNYNYYYFNDIFWTKSYVGFQLPFENIVSDNLDNFFYERYYKKGEKSIAKDEVPLALKYFCDAYSLKPSKQLSKLLAQLYYKEGKKQIENGNFENASACLRSSLSYNFDNKIINDYKKLNEYLYYQKTGNQFYLYFDGVDDFIDCGESNLYNDSTNFSISFWVKPDSIQNSVCDIIDYSHGKIGGWVVQQGVNHNNLYSLAKNDDGNYSGELFFSLDPEIWQHIVIRKQGNLLNVFKNGNKLGIYGRVYDKTYPGTRNLTIGSLSGGVARFFRGSISNIMIFNSGLSNLDVTSIYNGSKNGTNQHKVINLELNEGSESRVYEGIKGISYSISGATWRFVEIDTINYLSKGLCMQLIENKFNYASMFSNFFSQKSTTDKNKLINLNNEIIKESRLARWKYAELIWIDNYKWYHKLFGHGFDYLSWYGDFFHGNSKRYDYPHNTIISSFLYSGIIGGVFYLYFLILSVFLYWKLRKKLLVFFITYLITVFFMLFSGNSHFSVPLFAFLSVLPFLFRDSLKNNANLS